MAGYGTVRTFAQHLGEREIAEMLQETLNEEGAADEKLTQMAQHINEAAAEPSNTSAHAGAAEELEDEEDGEESE